MKWKITYLQNLQKSQNLWSPSNSDTNRIDLKTQVREFETINIQHYCIQSAYYFSFRNVAENSILPNSNKMRAEFCLVSV